MTTLLSAMSISSQCIHTPFLLLLLNIGSNTAASTSVAEIYVVVGKSVSV